MPWLRVGGGLWRHMEANWKGLVIFSEADGLTAEAQAMLRDPLESYTATTRFIFTTNSLDNLDEAIRSRCKRIEMGPPPFEERVRILSAVLANERVEVPPLTIVRFAEAHEDMREMLRDAQDSILAHGELRVARNDAVNAQAWPEPVDGAELLDAIASAFARYVALPDGAATALALWVVFTHAHEAFDYSPLLTVTSPVKRSGKTRLFRVLSELTPNPIFASNATPPVIFRLGGAVDDVQERLQRSHAPPRLTLLLDEGDTWLKLHSEMHGVLNSGHTRRGAFVMRMDGGEPRPFSSWFPKAIALIDKKSSDVPTTLLDRSIVIQMRRRRANEVVAVLRADKTIDELNLLRRQSARWGRDLFERLYDANPALPAVDDRTADNWRPLLAIADIAGGHWPERARAACLLLAGVEEESGEHRVLLLQDIRDVFERDSARPTRLPTSVLVNALRAIDDHPWRTLDAFGLAQLLRGFGVRPRALWDDIGAGRKGTIRGYDFDDLKEAFDRYLGPGVAVPVRDARAPIAQRLTQDPDPQESRKGVENAADHVTESNQHDAGDDDQAASVGR